MIRGVTFDLDGTLADTLPVCYAAFRAVFLEHAGREFSDSEIHALFGPCEKGALAKVVADWKPAFEKFLTEYERAHSLCPLPFEGIPALLDSLAALGINVAVVTGKGPESAAISLRTLGLKHHFAIVEAGSPERAIKADAIQRVLDVWGLTRSEVIHIGDAPGDIRAARTVGVGAVGAVWASTARRDLLDEIGPDAVFDRVDAFGEWLRLQCSVDAT
jgi:pyrophosphatase PpaX